MGKDDALGQIRSDLSRLETKKRLKNKDFIRLEEILSQTGSLVAKDREYERLYRWALGIHKGKSKPPSQPPRANKRIGPSGLVENPGLSQGGREVLGGLPGSRRGH
ncbi:hypothetical protein [Mycobacterium sp. OTB74]|jgi:hypothetical protein|uniref:hypothetical protein n=1 Tax=Mycobacterium sp. OTB74 TaxID=1853452 RepID=UPI002474FF2B|nr:hypothetical protein [Mycobacterium sp. OTB74]MDH6245506.1 hypothetical protein [Mycobacterium sp. OTB74]